MNRSEILHLIPRTLSVNGAQGRVEKVRVHPHAHMDEYVCTEIVKRYGAELFPGIQEARLVQKPVRPSENFWGRLADGELLIGHGRGPFDEHKENGQRDGKKSATLLAVELLGVRPTDRALCDLVHCVTDEDSSGSSACRLNIAYILKVINRMNAAESDGFDPTKWAQTAAQAYLDFKGMARPAVRVPQFEVTYLKKELFAAFNLRVVEELGEQYMREMRYWVHDTVGQYVKSVKPYGMAYTATLLLIMHGKDVMHEWVLEGLRAEFLRRLHFASSLQYFRGEQQGAFTIPVEGVSDSEGKPVRLAFVKFGNPEAARAAMSQKGYHSAVVVIRDPRRGNTQILFNKEGYNLSEEMMEWVGVEIRSLEPSRWDTPFMGLILNGSHSHPDVPPTRMSDVLIARILTEGFRRYM